MLWLVLGLAAMLVLNGCGQKLRRQPKAKPYSPSSFFADGKSARPLASDTVAQGYLGANKLFLRGSAPADRQTSGAQSDQLTSAMPFQVTSKVLARGQDRLHIYCSPCHGRIGDGDGMIVRRGFTRPPSYFEDRLLTAPIGHFVNVMTGGFGRMPDYALQVPPEDRWMIAAYIRALQLSQRADISLVPPQERQKLSHPPQKGASR